MKELSIEEKAKRYDDAINAIKELKAKHPTAHVIKDWIKENFPELAESEDEKIRKWLICTLKSLNNSPVQIDGAYEMMLPAINWLEKQNPAWSEEDKCMLNNVIDTLKPLSQTTHSGYAINSMIDWLKSLRHQNTWKPSDEQMITLRHVISGCSYDIEPLVELETKLKEL